MWLACRQLRRESGAPVTDAVLMAAWRPPTTHRISWNLART